MPFDFQSILPPGWLLEYVKAHQGYDEVPASLHTFAMLSGFGTLFGRRVRILRGSGHPIDTTQSVVLVAPSGEGKGIAINRCSLMLESAAPNFLITGGKATMVGILKRFDPEEARGLIVAPELGGMFGKQQYNTNFDMEMTDFLDNNNTYRWETGGTALDVNKGIYRNVAAAILAGTTASWIRRAIPGTALEDGFFSRVFWVREVSEPIYNPTPPPVVPGWNPLVNQLHQFYQRIYNGPPIMLDIHDEAKPEVKAWLDWYNKHYSMMPKGDPWQRGWWKRKPSNFLQLSLILSLSKVARYGGAIGLDVEAMQGAAKILEWGEPGIQKISEEMGRISPQHEIRTKVLSIIATNGYQMSDSEVHRRVAYHTGLKENTDKVMWELTESGLVNEQRIQNPDTKRYVKGWVLTDKGKDIFR